MDFNLLQKLLPGEVIEYTTRQGVRASDGREFKQHRAFQITRTVMSQSVKSCSVKLGGTHVICSVREIKQEQCVLQTGKIVVQLQMTKDIQSMSLRRDLVEDKETQLKAFLAKTIGLVCQLTLAFQFNVIADQGNLISALVAGTCDLLAQIGQPADLWACLLLQYETIEGIKQWIVDPSYEECCNLSNVLVLVTKVGPKHIVQVGADQNRTSYSIHHSQTLQFKPSTVSFRDLKEAILLGEVICDKALMGLSSAAQYEITV